MLDNILDAAVSALRQAGIEHWELMLVKGSDLSLGVKGDQLERISEAETLGLAIRLLYHGGLGFSYLLGSDLSRLPAAIALAKSGALASTPVPGFSFAPPASPLPEDPPPTPPEAPPLIIDRALSMAKAARAFSPLINHVYPAEVEVSRQRLLLRTSAGFAGGYSKNIIWAGCAAIAGRDGQQEEAWESRIAADWRQLDLEEVGRAAASKAVSALGAAPVSGGKYQVLLDSEVASYFLGLLAFSLKADNISKSRSQLADKLGRQICSPRITLRDDPLLPAAPHSRPFDDEGVPSRPTTMIADGIMRDYICDRYWGLRLGRESTGNSSRAAVKSPPEIDFSNLTLLAGEADCAALTAGMDRGIIVQQVLGGHTADPVSGQFSLGLSGQLVEGGKIVRPVRGNAFAGQVIQLFANVEAVGNDLRCFGKIWAPSLLVGGLSVSGPSA
jgi:PmbA protein